VADGAGGESEPDAEIVPDPHPTSSAKGFQGSRRGAVPDGARETVDMAVDRLWQRWYPGSCAVTVFERSLERVWAIVVTFG
jgi:hypothetical protein